MAKLPEQADSPRVDLTILLDSDGVSDAIRKGLVNGGGVDVDQLGLGVDVLDLSIDAFHDVGVALGAFHLDGQLICGVHGIKFAVGSGLRSWALIASP